MKIEYISRRGGIGIRAKIEYISRRGGIGIRARLRGVWGNPCGFKSRRRHHKNKVALCHFYFYNVYGKDWKRFLAGCEFYVRV